VLRHAALYEAWRDRTGANSLYPSLALELAARVIGERPHLRDGFSPEQEEIMSMSLHFNCYVICIANISHFTDSRRITVHESRSSLAK
jgi:hypothetical protein